MNSINMQTLVQAQGADRLPLAGIRILDLSAVIMGPYCTQILGDLGAEIIKVEGPDGDIIRNVGPAKRSGMAAMFMANNRGKKSIGVDLATAEGREICFELAKSSDVIIHSMRPSSIGKLGLGYEDLKKVAPDLIYCALVGFGLDGPYAGKPAYDDIIQSASGLTALETELHGKPGYAATVVADKVSALTAAWSIMAALIARMNGAGGQYLEVAMFETMVGFNLVEHICGAIYPEPISRPAYSRVLSPNRRPYKTRTFDITALVHTDRHFDKFCDHIGRPEMRSDPRFATIAQRTVNVNEYYAFLEEQFAQRDGEEWVRFLEQTEIPVQKITSLDEIFDDPHLKATGFFKTIPQDGEGEIRVPSQGVTFSGTPLRTSLHAPLHGEHSREVLRMAGYDETRIDALVASGVVLSRDVT